MKSKKIIMIIGITLITTISTGALTSANIENSNISTRTPATGTIGTETPSTETPIVVEGTETPKDEENVKFSSEKDFKFDEKTGTIEAYYGNDKVLKIPESINGVTVRRILSKTKAPGLGEHQISFVSNGAPNVEEVIIPKTVKVIGDYAFLGCINLKKVVLSDGLKVIGNSAFYGCSLEEINIPDTVVLIKPLAFAHNDKLSTVKIPENLRIGTALSDTLFEKENEEKNNGLLIINNVVEDYKGSGEIINIPEGVKEISSLNYKNYEVKEINFPKSLEYISTTFCDFTNLSKVTFPEGCNIKFIKEEGFSNCKISIINIPSPNFKGQYNIINSSQKLIVNGKEILQEDIIKEMERPDSSKFIFDRNTGTLSGYIGNDRNLIIPYEIDNIPVKYIEASDESVKKGFGILGQNSIVENIIFKCNGEIKSNAFLNSESLKNVTYNSVNKVDKEAFNNCKNLVAESGHRNASKESYNGTPLQDYFNISSTAGTFDNNKLLVLLLTIMSSMFILFNNKIKSFVKNIFCK